MHSNEVQKLKVGDVVAISPPHMSRHKPYIVDVVVTKVNGHGHVTCTKDNREYKFDKHGNEYGRSKFSSYYNVLVVNDLAKLRNDAANDQHELNIRVNAVLTLINEHKGYSNNYNISPEVKEKLLEMVAAI